jgi:hypothetical protein
MFEGRRAYNGNGWSAFKCVRYSTSYYCLINFNFGKLHSQNIFVAGSVIMHDAWLLNNETSRRSWPWQLLTAGYFSIRVPNHAPLH